MRDLVESGVESLTVALINSYVNGAHEREIGEIVERLYPGFPVTLSSDVLPEFREYERALTACMNSYVRPKVADYVKRLQEQLNGIGAKAEVNILRSDAGLMTTREAARNPIYGVLSGPSGGVAGALFVARKAGFDDILTFDMGGTSTDVALCQNGQPTIGRETAIGHFRIKVPSVNVHTVGAGGGSIAHVPGADEGAARRPAVGGRRAGPGRVRQGRRPSRPSPTRTSCSATCRRACSAARWSSTSTRRARPCRRSRTRWGSSRSSRPPRGSSRSSTRTWPARCGSSPSSAATTRATSRSSPTAARGRCTRTRWRS